MQQDRYNISQHYIFHQLFFCKLLLTLVNFPSTFIFHTIDCPTCFVLVYIDNKLHHFQSFATSLLSHYLPMKCTLLFTFSKFRVNTFSHNCLYQNQGAQKQTSKKNMYQYTLEIVLLLELIFVIVNKSEYELFISPQPT